jgi:hypothetical protein
MTVKKCVLNFSNFYYWSSLNYLVPFRHFDKIKLINVNLHNFYRPINILFKQTDGQTIECDAQPLKRMMPVDQFYDLLHSNPIAGHVY